MSEIIWLDECSDDDAEIVGGKAHGLAELFQAGLRVPPGFVVTANAYRSFLEDARLVEVVRDLASRATDAEGRAAAEREIAQRFVSAAAVEVELWPDVRAAYRRLCDEVGAVDVPVAVRSSATAEDRVDASFAGEYETELWIRGEDEVSRAIASCWASLYTGRALSYLAQLGIDPADVAMGVVVQLMVPAEAAGVMMTLNPVTGDRDQIVIEACHGLGLGVVNGELTPDHFQVTRGTDDVALRLVAPKRRMYAFDPSSGRVHQVDVPEHLQREPSVTDAELVEIARLGVEIESHHDTAMDVEWAIGPGPDGGRQLFLLQARPETVFSRQQATTR